LIVKHAWRNRTAVEDVAAEEVGDAITLSWNRSKCPVAWSTEEVIRYVEQCSKPRDAWSDPPPCVFVGEGYVYLLPGDLKRWYSLPNAGGRDIPWVTMRRGLKQLGFEQHNLCRRDDGRRCDRRAWRALVHGPAGELVKRYVDDEGSAS
jgi:hypothetical protein